MFHEIFISGIECYITISCLIYWKDVFIENLCPELLVNLISYKLSDPKVRIHVERYFFLGTQSPTGKKYNHPPQTDLSTSNVGLCEIFWT